MKKTAGNDVIYPELSYQFTGIAFDIHNALGPGFVESIYEEAFAIELENHAIPFERQKVIQVAYQVRVIGTHRLDLLVDNKIILELKAVSALNDVFKQQLLSYLKATGLRLGLLINFGSGAVQSARIVN